MRRPPQLRGKRTLASPFHDRRDTDDHRHHFQRSSPRGSQSPPRHGRGDCRAEIPVSGPGSDRRGGAPPACAYADLDRQRAAGRRRISESAGEVQEIVRICARHRAPIIPFGAGTSLEGHVNAPAGRHLARPQSRMNRCSQVNARGPRRVVEAGVTREQLNESSARHRPVLPHRPRRRDATLGGMAVDARLRHQRRALRHHARERARAEGRARRRPLIRDRAARAQISRRLRPDAAFRRRRRHARHHHRGHAQALRHARSRSVPPSAASRRSRAPATP